MTCRASERTGLVGPRFNPPPGWPLPHDFVPSAGWQPDPSWPPAPAGWQLWVSDEAAPGGTFTMPQGGGYPGGPSDGTLPPAPPVYPYQMYGQAAQPVNPGNNGFALAGFILGILGTIVLAVPFSIVGLVQIRRTRQRGKGLAITGLVLSGVWVLIGAIVIVIAIGSQATRSSGGAITSTGQVNIFSLRVGDCFQNPAASQSAGGVTDVTAVACTTPHNAQAFAQFDATEASYPGTKALIAEAAHGCRTRIATSLDKSKITSTMQLRFLYPEPQAWTDGRRIITCLVVDSTKDLTSSLLAR